MDDASDWLGAPVRDVANGLLDFARSSELLSNDSQLVGKYAQKWVGVSNGEVRSTGDDIDSLLKKLDTLGVPRAETAVRFIEREPRTLIL